MRLKRTMIPRAGAFLLVLLPLLALGVLVWISDLPFFWKEEVEFVALLGPTCLLAMWCALGQTNILLRFTIVALALSAWHFLTDRFELDYDSIDGPYLVALFGTFTLPLCLLRLSGVSIQLTHGPIPMGDSPPSGDIQRAFSRFSLRSLLQVVTLGALLMAADRLGGFSQLFDFDEFLTGFVISPVIACVAWVVLGTRRLWLRLLAWLATPVMLYGLYLLIDGELNVIFLRTTELNAVLVAWLLGFRRLGYRLVWGTAPVVSDSVDPIAWKTLLKSAAAVVAIACYLWLFGKSIAWSQQHLMLWYIDGMATFGAIIMVTLQAPILLLAIWCALGGANLSLRLVSTIVGCCLGMAYLEFARPYAPLAIETKQIYQHLLAMAIPLFAFRPWGFAIRRRQGAIDDDVTRDPEPQFGLRSVFIVITTAAILMGLNQFSPLFEGMFAFATLRGLLLANLMVVAIVYACLSTACWWLRAIPWLLCSLLSTCLLSEFPLRNFAWVASMSAAVGGVLLAFRLGGYRFLRPQSSRATSPALPAFNPLPEFTESFTLAVNK